MTETLTSARAKQPAMGLGVDRYMNQVDGDPETRTGTISADCPVGALHPSSQHLHPRQRGTGVGLRWLTVSGPAEQQQTEPPSTDATLSGLSEAMSPWHSHQPPPGYTASVGNARGGNHHHSDDERRWGHVRNQARWHNRRGWDGGLGRGRERHHRRGDRRGRTDHQDLHGNRDARRIGIKQSTAGGGRVIETGSGGCAVSSHDAGGHDNRRNHVLRQP